MTACIKRTARMGPPSSVSVQSCRLISDTARKTYRQQSEMTASALVRAGHVNLGRTKGTALDAAMPKRGQGTKSGSFWPASMIAGRQIKPSKIATRTANMPRIGLTWLIRLSGLS